MNKRAPAGNAEAILVSTSSPSCQQEQAHLRHIGAASSFPLAKKEDAGSNFISDATAALPRKRGDPSFAEPRVEWKIDDLKTAICAQ